MRTAHAAVAREVPLPRCVIPSPPSTEILTARLCLWLATYNEDKL